MANSYSNNSTSCWKKRIVDFLILLPVDNSEEEVGPILRGEKGLHGHCEVSTYMII